MGCRVSKQSGNSSSKCSDRYCTNCKYGKFSLKHGYGNNLNNDNLISDTVADQALPGSIPEIPYDEGDVNDLNDQITRLITEILNGRFKHAIMRLEGEGGKGIDKEVLNVLHTWQKVIMTKGNTFFNNNSSGSGVEESLTENKMESKNDEKENTDAEANNETTTVTTVSELNNNKEETVTDTVKSDDNNIDDFQSAVQIAADSTTLTTGGPGSDEPLSKSRTMLVMAIESAMKALNDLELAKIRMELMENLNNSLDKVEVDLNKELEQQLVENLNDTVTKEEEQIETQAATEAIVIQEEDTQTVPNITSSSKSDSLEPELQGGLGLNDNDEEISQTAAEKSEINQAETDGGLGLGSLNQDANDDDNPASPRDIDTTNLEGPSDKKSVTAAATIGSPETEIQNVINETNNKPTLPEEQVRSDGLKLIKLLLQRGADPNIPETRVFPTQTQIHYPLRIAITGADPELVEILLNVTAVTSEDINDNQVTVADPLKGCYLIGGKKQSVTSESVNNDTNNLNSTDNVDHGPSESNPIEIHDNNLIYVDRKITIHNLKLQEYATSVTVNAESTVNDNLNHHVNEGKEIEMHLLNRFERIKQSLEPLLSGTGPAGSTANIESGVVNGGPPRTNTKSNTGHSSSHDSSGNSSSLTEQAGPGGPKNGNNNSVNSDRRRSLRGRGSNNDEIDSTGGSATGSDEVKHPENTGV